MFKKLNLQFLISYLGYLPFLFVIIEKFLFNIFKPAILKDFIVLYSIIIFVFIGAINWNLRENIPTKLLVIGFLPSLCSIFIIILYLSSYDVYLIIIILLLIQLVIEKYFNKKKFERKIYYMVRAPLTFLILISLIIIQF
jgi:hypothetical protein